MLTNDGHAILREIDVAHPAAKSMIQLSRAQDDEVGDGTTSVIILAGELLQAAEPLLERNLHPTVVVRGYARALEDALRVARAMSFPIDTSDRAAMLGVVSSCIGTKYTSRFGSLMAELALDAVQTVAADLGGGSLEVDVKNYAKVEKIPGGTIEDCKVLKGVMFNKDVVVPGRMRRRIANPRILLLDCPLEYKKGESQTNVEITREEDWCACGWDAWCMWRMLSPALVFLSHTRSRHATQTHALPPTSSSQHPHHHQHQHCNRAALLKAEEEWVAATCAAIAAHKPDLVITEKGLSDLAAHFLTKAGISAIRRLRKTDNNRIARATGATIVHRPEEIREADIGTGAGLFEVVKIGDEFFSFIVDCKVRVRVGVVCGRCAVGGVV